MDDIQSLQNENSRLKEEIKERDDWINILINQKRKFQNIINTYQNVVPDPTTLLHKTDKQDIESIEKIYDEYEKKLVWIFGTPRSGSTWLVRDILKMDRIAVLDESGIGILLGAYRDDPMPFYHMVRGTYPIKLRRIIDQEKNFAFFSAAYEKIWAKSLKRMIVDRISAQFPVTAFDLILIKAPNESHASDIIMKCFPKSRLIFLIRDGRDVIDSRQSKFHNPRTGMEPETPEERKFRINYFSSLWNLHVEITKKAYESHDPKLRLLLKYEDLRIKPIEQIEKINQFLDLSLPMDKIKEIADETKFENVPSFMKGDDKNIRKAIPGSWKTYFSTDERKMANAIMKENLEEFGYEI